MVVSNAHWGPPLWRILHACAERLGTHKHAMIIADEARTWVQLLRSIEVVMPCPLCRTHYREYRKTYPIEAFMALSGEPFRVAAREWLWRLHDGVNRSRGIEDGMQLENVPAFYATRQKQEVQQDVEALVKVLREATVLRFVKGDDLTTFRTKLSHLRKFVGLI